MKYRNFLIWMPVVAFVCLLLAGLVVSVLSLKKLTAQDWSELGNPAKILSGESTKHFTKLLNKNFVLGAVFNRVEHAIQWNLIGDMGSSVRSGCDDWLFLSDELEIYPDSTKSASARVELAAILNERLQSRGIKLLMVVVPDKTRIESAHLCGLNRSFSFENRIMSWLNTLKSRSVTVLSLTDTLSALQGDRYYHTDTHWNESGSNAAARAVAADLWKLGWATPASSREVVLNLLLQPRPGDLVHLAGLDGLPGFLRPKVELAKISVVPPVAVASDDLFGNAGLPTIALIGTSYSRNSNFVPFLENHLGEPVANLAKDGGDFAGAATAYFSGSTFRDNPPKTVIWEVPERVIEKPLSEVERQWLEKLKKGGL